MSNVYFQLKWPVSNNDVLNGRGVKLSHHEGNRRFRALVKARYDPEYTSVYSLSEKRALAEEIISHIKSLNPPGRFLRRPKSVSAAVDKPTEIFEGSWIELTPEETVKKTCQALRDCSRSDRAGYGVSVDIEADDVTDSAKSRIRTGMTNKELAQLAVEASVKKSECPGSAFTPWKEHPIGQVDLSSSTQSKNHKQQSEPPKAVKPESTSESSPVPSWIANDPLRGVTPPVYEPATEQQWTETIIMEPTF